MALYERERFGPYGRGSPLYGDQASAEARERALRSVFSKDTQCCQLCVARVLLGNRTCFFHLPCHDC